MHGTVHGPGYSGGNGISMSRIVSGAPLSADFHVYAIEWFANLVVFSVDGNTYFTVTPAAAAGGDAVGVRPSVRRHPRPRRRWRLRRAARRHDDLSADAARRLRARLRAAAVSARVRPLLLAALVAGCTASASPSSSLPSGAVLSISVEQAERVGAQLQPARVGSGALADARRRLRAAAHLQHRRGRLRAVARHGLRWSADHLRADGAPCATARWSDGARFRRRRRRLHLRAPARAPRARPANVWDFLRTCAPSTRSPSSCASGASTCPASSTSRSSRSCPAHVWRDVADPRDLHQPEPRRHRARSPRCASSATRSTSSAGTRSTGSRASRASRRCACSPIPRNEQANLALVEGDDRLGGRLRAVRRAHVRRPRSGAQRLLVPARGQHGVPLSQHGARAVRRRARAQGDQHGHRSPARRRRRPCTATRRPPTAPGCPDAYAGWRDPALAARAGCSHDVARRHRLLDEGGYARGATACAAARRSPLRLRRRGRQRLVRLGARGARHRARSRARSASTSSCAPTNSAPGSRACRRASSSCRSPAGWPVVRRAERRTASTAGSCRRARCGRSASWRATNWHRFGDARDRRAARALRGHRRRRAPARAHARRSRSASSRRRRPSRCSRTRLWGVFSTRRFDGFPSAEHPYANAVAAPRARATARADDARQGHAGARRPTRDAP